MSTLKGWLVRVRRALNPTAHEKQMAEEMRQHLEMEAAARRAAGENPDDAQRAAAVDFGPVEAYKEQVRDRRLGRYAAEFRQDLGHACRLMLRSPGYSAAVIATIGIGIGINTAIFTAAQSVLFRPMAGPDGDRLVTVADVNLTRTNRPGVSWPDFQAYRARNTTFEKLEAGLMESVSLGDAHLPAGQFTALRITPGLFGLMQTSPIIGRAFTPADSRPGAEPAVLIGHHVWRGYYAGTDVIGRSIRLNGSPATIIGVMPEGFRFPTVMDVWVALAPTPELEKRTARELMLFGLLKPGTPPTRANRDLARITAELAAEFPGEIDPRYAVLTRTFQQTYVGSAAREGALLLVVAVGLVLAIACANVSNLMLSRGLARSREISMRAALGAGRARIVRQLLTESVLLGLGGGVLGLGIAALGARALTLGTAGSGMPMPYWIRFDLDYGVLAYLTAISVLCGIVCGLAPALRSSRTDLNVILKNGTPAGGTRREGRLAGALTILQFALSVTLLAGAGMIWRSFHALSEFNTMVPAERILTAGLRLPDQPGQAYANPDARRRFITALVERLQALPGATHASVTTQVPGMGSRRARLEIEGAPVVSPDKAPLVAYTVQSPGHLETVNLALRSGRHLQATDGRPGVEAAVITEAFARRHWPEGSAVGRRFRFVDPKGSGPWIEVVGVCADFFENPMATVPAVLAFIPVEQMPPTSFRLLVRTAGDPTGLATAVRQAVQELDPDVALLQLQPLTGALEEIRWSARFFGALFFVFSAAGLLTAAVGVYATVACATSRRTREIGIRMALGATSLRVLRLILTQGLRQIVIGVGLGLVGGVLLARVMRQTGMLLRVPPPDPVLFGAIALLVAAIGLIACVLPARRATLVAPTEALRVE